MNFEYPRTKHCPNCLAFAKRLDVAELQARTRRTELICATALCGILAGVIVAVCLLS